MQLNIVIAEYIWIGGISPTDLRSKARTLVNPITNISEIPEWSFDGSSCNQASVSKSDITLIPVQVFNDPFRGKPHILVLCECVYTDRTPVKNNYRHITTLIQSQCQQQEPWFGFEQEYIILQSDSPCIKKPIGWSDNGFPVQGQSYCGVGSSSCFGRELVNKHYEYCLQAGIQICGINAEVMPGQWEFQIGPSSPIQAADHLIMARYILLRTAELYNYSISFNPKLIDGFSGSGLHTNYSTIDIRNKTSNSITQSIIDLGNNHNQHMIFYGTNKQRLTGTHETSSFDTFTYGMSDRSASVRIPTSQTYLEDRRPASDANPYLVTSVILDTTLLQSSLMSEINSIYTE